MFGSMGLKRRQRFDPFTDSKGPHRMVVENRYSQEISSRDVPTGADLRKEIEIEATRWAAEGWEIEREGGNPFRSPSFFMRKDGERRAVHLFPSGPGIGMTSDPFRNSSQAASLALNPRQE